MALWMLFPCCVGISGKVTIYPRNNAQQPSLLLPIITTLYKLETLTTNATIKEGMSHSQKLELESLAPKRDYKIDIYRRFKGCRTEYFVGK